MRYRAEVDGLRAVAVVPVILYHAGFDLFSGGYVGVDVFFVISGYLIASILIKSLSSNTFSLGEFYERRARRILPALVVVVLACFIGSWIWMVPSQTENLSHSIIATVLFVSNVFFWRTTDYFSPDSDMNPLLHTWSLAVEEQFYLIFPLLLLFLWNRGRLRIAVMTMAAVTLASFAAAEISVRTMPVASFYLLPTRGWELGVGILCAFYLHQRAPAANEYGAFAGIALILTAVFGFDSTTPFPSTYTLLPVVGTACIILFATHQTFVGRILSARVLVGIGLISYSAYLWHHPLFAFARIAHEANEPAAWFMALLAIASVGLAFFTWRWIEVPFRRRPTPLIPHRRSLFLVGGFACYLCLVVGVAGHLTDGFRAAWHRFHPEAVPTLTVINASTARARERLADGNCRFSVEAMTPDALEKIRECAAEAGPIVLVLGDSHAIDLYNGIILNQLFAASPVVGVSASECRFHYERTDCYRGVLAAVRENPTLFRDIYYTQSGFHLLQTVDGRIGRNIISGYPMRTALTVESYRLHELNVFQVASALGELGSVVPTTWIGPRIEPHLSRSLILQRGCDAEFRLRPGQREIYQRLDERLATGSTGAQFSYLSQIRATGFNMETDFISCDRWLWRDGDHWSMEGAALFVWRMAEAGFFDGSEPMVGDE